MKFFSNSGFMRYQLSILVLILFFVVYITTPLCAAPTECPTHYMNGIAPDILSAQKAAKTRELCFDNFVVMHSGISRTPLWSAEHLTHSGLREAKGLRRSNEFHPEDRLPASEKAELRDYARSGFDRGHMSPSGDMPTARAQWESFTLANMIPQDPENNRHLWEGIESAVRTLAKKAGDLYVITGPLFLGNSVKQLHGRVLVPTNIYKIVYDPHKRRGAVYFVKNESGNDWQAISIIQLENLAGINFFPNLSVSDKQAMLDLPEPTPYNNGSHHHRTHSNRVLKSMFH